MDVHAPGGRSLRVVVPVGRVDVGKAVAVHVARHGQEHSAQSAAGLVGLDHERGLRAQSTVDEHASALSLPRAGRAHEEEPVRLVGVARDRGAEAIARPLAGQGEQRAPGLAGIHVGATRARAARVVPRRAHDHVGEAVAVHVAHSVGVLAELIVPAFGG